MYSFMIAAFMISFLYTETDCGTLHKFPLRKRKANEVTASLTANNPPTLHC